METGAIIALKTNISAVGIPLYVRTYYIVQDGEFEIPSRDEESFYKFKGQHFVCLGSDYFHGTKGHIGGFEILDSPHEPVVIIPDNLIP